jgi:hypothetical protein
MALIRLGTIYLICAVILLIAKTADAVILMGIWPSEPIAQQQCQDYADTQQGRNCEDDGSRTGESRCANGRAHSYRVDPADGGDRRTFRGCTDGCLYGSGPAGYCLPEPTPETCEAKTNKYAITVQDANGIFPPDCYAGCEIIPSGVIINLAPSGTPSQSYIFNGATCGTVTQVTDAADDNGCITSDSNVVCASETVPNCGTFNGELICVDDVPGNGCIETPNGQNMCVSTAETPPQPDNGNPGQQANPDGTVTTVTHTYNYYNSTTSSGSSDQTPDTSQIPGQISDPDLDPHTNEGESGDIFDGDCDPTIQNCQPGDLPGLEDTKTISQSTSDFMNRVSGSPIITSVKNLSASVPQANCPTPSFSAFGSTFTFTTHCLLYNEISGFLKAAFLAMWSLVGVRIFLSA